MLQRGFVGVGWGFFYTKVSINANWSLSYS